MGLVVITFNFVIVYLMNWLVLTLLAIIFRSFQSITVKVLSNSAKVSPMAQSVLFTGAAAILSLIISPIIGGISTAGLSELWAVALIMVLAQSFGNILFFKGLAALEASVTAIAFSSILLWSVILSVMFLGSSFSIVQIFGIVFLFAAIVMVQYKKGVKKVEPAILYIVFSALLFAVFQVSSAELAKTVPAATYLLLNFAGATVIVWLIYFKRVNSDLKELSRQKLMVSQAVALAAICSTGYFVFSYFAYMAAPDRGVVVVLLTSQVVLSVILGILLLKERENTGRKLGAGFLALIAGILIKS